MPRFAWILLQVVCVVATPSALTEIDAWPEPTQSARPWTRWWWPGSAVDETNLAPFDRAFAEFALRNARLRAQFHDSFEYYEAGWTAELPHVFRQLHGYDLQQFATGLLDESPADPERQKRLKADYRATLAAPDPAPEILDGTLARSRTAAIRRDGAPSDRVHRAKRRRG